MIDPTGSDAMLRAAQQARQASEVARTEPLARAKDGEEDFEQMLTRLIGEVDQAQKEADDSIRRLAAGEDTSIQDVVSRLGEADITFKLMKEIRDKLVSAYKEVISMQP